MQRRKLSLPRTLAVSTVGLALALGVAGCGDDDGGPDHNLFCFEDTSIDAGPDFDADVCPPTVERAEDCPPGCRAVG